MLGREPGRSRVSRRALVPRISGIVRSGNAKCIGIKLNTEKNGGQRLYPRGTRVRRRWIYPDAYRI
jgi:hypothetical protein